MKPMDRDQDAGSGRLSSLGRGATRGRGATGNPVNRFVRRGLAVDGNALDGVHEADAAALGPVRGAADRVHTQVIDDGSRSILTRNTSSDIPFGVSLNPYRGCEHGCAYCYARPTHEYLGYSAGLDFETRILAKRRAAELLDAELRHEELDAARPGHQRRRGHPCVLAACPAGGEQRLEASGGGTTDKHRAAVIKLQVRGGRPARAQPSPVPLGKHRLTLSAS